MKAFAATAVFLALLQIVYSESPAADKKSTPEPAKATLHFKAYAGDPGNPAGMTFQINGAGPPTHFLQMGEYIPKTHLQLTSFDANGPKLTLTNTVTKETLVLTMPKVIDAKKP
jgi:hypothetical protein